MTRHASLQRRRRQRGASAIEFAFIFPFFFGLIYMMISYGLLFGLQHSITASAKEAARSAVACDPTVEETEHEDCVTERVRATATASLDWLPGDLQGRILGAGGEGVDVTFQDAGAAGKTVEVLVQLPGYSADPILPTVTLPFLGAVPPLPARLAGRAVVAL